MHTKKIIEKVLYIGHGSREERWNREFLAVVMEIQKKFPSLDILPYFLHRRVDTLSRDIETWIREGTTRFLLIPCFLFPGKHAGTDLGGILQKFRSLHPGKVFQVSEPLGQSPGIQELVLKRVSETPGLSGSTAILFLTLGGDAKKNQSFIQGLEYTLRDGGHAQEVFYTSLDFECKGVLEVLQNIQQDGHKRVTLFPFLLFDGFLLNFLREKIPSIQEAFPGIHFDLCPHLGQDALLFQELEKSLSHDWPLHT